MIYVHYQYRQQLPDREVLSAVDRVLDGSYAASGDDTLEKHLANTLLGNGTMRRAFSGTEALNALRSVRDAVDRAVASDHRYLAEMVMRNYRTFLPLLRSNYSDMTARGRTVAQIHNHFDAETEIYRASCYMLPGTGEYAEGIFGTMYASQEYAAMMQDTELRSIEFLQWYCTAFVIPTVEMSPPDWYMTVFGTMLSDRVRPIFDGVISQRNSIFTVSRFQKNRATFVDVFSEEEFDVRIRKGLDVPSGPMIGATLIRHASMFDINSMLKLLPEEDASDITQDIRRRKEAMAALGKKFTERNGHAVIYSRAADAVSAYNSFISVSDYPGKEEMGAPRLLNAEVTAPYPDHRVALLCEENNFYVSLHYPLLMDVMEGSMRGKAAADVAEVSFGNRLALPFTTLKRLYFTDAARLLSALRTIRPDIDSVEEMGTYITRSRRHTFLYSPVPLFSGLRKIADRYAPVD